MKTIHINRDMSKNISIVSTVVLVPASNGVLVYDEMYFARRS
jgi:hypothetical protein